MTDHPTNELSLYALDLVEPAERGAIARHLETCQSCREELRSYQAALSSLSEGVEREAGRALRERIVARERSAPGFAPLRRRALALSLVAAIVLATVAALSLRQLDELRAQRDEYARALAEVAEGARVVPLTARTGGRAALVVPQSGQPVLLLDLPAPPAGKQYEAWVIRGGAAVRAGLAPPREGVVTVVLSQPVAAGDVAAVTLEVAGGVDQPTSEPIVAGGV
jgi:hypothetical protein